MKKEFIREKWVGGTAVVVIAVLVVWGATTQWPGGTKRRLDKAQEDLRTVQIAVETYFVDYCADILVYPENRLPLCLTTPIAYLGKAPFDRFSRGKETLRFVHQLGRANGTMYLIVSSGPDRDWDIEKLPLRHVIERKNESGESVVLSSEGDNYGFLTYPQLVEYLAQNNIAIYDPTNGLSSDGDLMRTNAH